MGTGYDWLLLHWSSLYWVDNFLYCLELLLFMLHRLGKLSIHFWQFLITLFDCVSLVILNHMIQLCILTENKLHALKEIYSATTFPEKLQFFLFRGKLIDKMQKRQIVPPCIAAVVYTDGNWLEFSIAQMWSECGTFSSRRGAVYCLDFILFMILQKQIQPWIQMHRRGHIYR